MKYENLSRLLTIIETDTSHMGMFEADITKNNNNVKDFFLFIKSHCKDFDWNRSSKAKRNL